LSGGAPVLNDLNDSIADQVCPFLVAVVFLRALYASMVKCNHRDIRKFRNTRAEKSDLEKKSPPSFPLKREGGFPS